MSAPPRPDPEPPQAPIFRVLDDEQETQLKALSWVSYVLHIVVAVAAVVPGASASVALLLLALLMDLLQRDLARGSWQESHFTWRINSVLWAGVLYVVSAPIFVLFLFLFNPAWWLISIWFLYRIIKGMLRMSDGRPVA